MTVSAEAIANYEVRAQDEVAAWLPVAMTLPNWTAHLRWSGGGLLFRDRSWSGLERLHLVAYDERGRELLVQDLTPVAEHLAGDGLVAIERYRTDDDWHAWIFFKAQEAQ
jgi:hypothetical protein